MLTSIEEAIQNATVDIATAWLPTSIQPHHVRVAWVDQLYNLHEQLASYQFFILFEPLHLHLFHQPQASSLAPSLNSLLQWLLDRRAPLPVEEEPTIFSDHAIQLLASPGVKEVISTLLPALQPGQVATLSLSSGTAEFASVLEHPAVFSSTASSQPILRCINNTVGSILRSSPPPISDDLVSSAVGLIRQERLNWFGPLLPTVTTKVVSDHGSFEIICGGKSSRPLDSLATARCEAIERFHLLYPPHHDLHLARIEDLPGPVIHPDSLFFIHQSDSLGRAGSSFHSRHTLYWVHATHALSGEPFFVPAQSVYFTSKLPDELSLIESTTNACALGASFAEASLFALFEAIERDAYFVMWYLRRSCIRIDPQSVELLDFRLLHRTLQRDYPQYQIYFFNITADIPAPSVAAFAVRSQGTGPKVVQAVCCRLDLERAMHGCLCDLAAELGQTQGDPRHELEDPTLVRTPEDHRDLYALDSSFSRLSFLGFEEAPLSSVSACRQDCSGPPQHNGSFNLTEVLMWLVTQCDAVGVPVLFRDLSLPAFSNRSIHAAKAITPNLCPVWFGDGNCRISLAPRIQSLANRYLNRTLNHVTDLNLDLHPFS